jgi:hypothetical protein
MGLGAAAPGTLENASDDAAIDPVSIADEVVQGLIPRKRLRDLTCNPFMLARLPAAAIHQINKSDG